MVFRLRVYHLNLFATVKPVRDYRRRKKQMKRKTAKGKIKKIIYRNVNNVVLCLIFSMISFSISHISIRRANRNFDLVSNGFHFVHTYISLYIITVTLHVWLKPLHSYIRNAHIDRLPFIRVTNSFTTRRLIYRLSLSEICFMSRCYITIINFQMVEKLNT